MWWIALTIIIGQIVLIAALYFRVPRLEGYSVVIFLLVPVVSVLLYFAYMDLVHWEQQYSKHPSVLNIDGYPLREHRFRAQRNFYMSGFSVVLLAGLYMIRTLRLREDFLSQANYKLNLRLDEIRD